MPVTEFEVVAEPSDKLVPAALTPVELLSMAVSQGADVDKLEKLMEMQLRWEQNEAKKAYHAAMNAFKADPPTISKNKHVHFKEVDYDHATLDQVCDVITGALSKHGISHRWKVKQADGLITVTCILTHEKGHSEETELSGNPDATGSKNSIQAIGSTVTYLQRYTLLAATGLAAKNGDNDGAGGAKLGDLKERVEFIGNARNLDELKTLYTKHFTDARNLKDVVSMNALVEAKNKRYKELA